MFLLKQLFQEHLAFQRNRYGADRVATAGAAIKVSEEDLKSRVSFDSSLLFFPSDHCLYRLVNTA